MKNILDIKPNTIIGENYEGEINLNSWKEFQSRQGFYGSKDNNEYSDGFFNVTIEGKIKDNLKIATIEQVNAIKYLVDNSDLIRDELLKGLLKELPKFKDIYEDLIPDIKKKEDFKKYIGLANLHIMDSDKDNYAYIGFELGCEWDEEHGIGVMMHKERVVAIGDADTSFNNWLTYDDNGTTEIETRKWEEENAKFQSERQNIENKKPWWKFW